MPTSILPKFGTATAITITLAPLANNSVRQGTIVDNSTTRYERVQVHVKVKLGTSPTAAGFVGVYLIRASTSGTPLRDDGAGASDAALAVKNARLIGSLYAGSAPSTGDVLTRVFVVEDPGPSWTVAVGNYTGVALGSTGSDHVVEFIGISPEVQ